MSVQEYWICVVVVHRIVKCVRHPSSKSWGPLAHDAQENGLVYASTMCLLILSLAVVKGEEC